MGLELAKAYVVARGDASGVAKDFNRAKPQVMSAARDMTSGINRILAGVGVGIGMAAIISQMKQYTALAERQIKAEQRVAAVVRATGGAAGFTAKQLREQAAALQAVTTEGDEAILEAQAVILTFKNITGSAFKETTELAFDLAQVMGQDVKSGALQLAKALEDPIRGVTALRRSGVSFNEQQKEQIKLLVESNRLNEAQALVLNTVKGQIGGVARAMAQTDAGKLQQARNVLGDMQEELGRKMIPVMTQFVELKMKLTSVLGPLVRLIADNIVVLGGLAASIVTVKVAIMGMNLALSGPGGFVKIMAVVAGTLATWALLSNEVDAAAEHVKSLREEWTGLKDEIAAATSNFTDFTSEQAKAAQQEASMKLAEAELKLKQFEVQTAERLIELEKKRGLLGERGYKAVKDVMEEGRQTLVREVQQAQAALNIATRGPKPTGAEPSETVKSIVGGVKSFLGGIVPGAKGAAAGMGQALGIRGAIQDLIGKGTGGLAAGVGRMEPGGTGLRFREEQAPLMAPGRHGFADFGKGLQDALLQRKDPVLQETKKQTKEIENTNKIMTTLAATLSPLGMGGFLTGPE